MDPLLIACCNRQGEYSSAALLANGVREFCGLESLPPIARTKQGKPFFPDFPQIQFNISHSKCYILLGIADSPIGVDIEHIRSRRPTLPRYALTDEEYQIYFANGGSWKDFYMLWTAKEAYCKYTGEGLTVPSRLIVPKSAPLKSFSGEHWCASVICDALEDTTELHWI